MYARVRELLTPEERLQYLRIPSDLSEWELSIYFTLTKHDIEIVQQHRRDYNRLGFAVQLCVIRYLGWTLFDVKEMPARILSYIAGQINVDASVFASYGERDATKYGHLDEIRKEYGYQSFAFSEYRCLYKHLFGQAMANGNALHLIHIAIEYLHGRKTILPSMPVIERAVWEARKHAEEKIFSQLAGSLTDAQMSELDGVLTAMPDSGRTRLAWLRDIPGTNSADSFLKLNEKIEYIRNLKLQIDTNGIHPNRLRQLSNLGSRYEPHSFRRFGKPKNYAILAAYLLELAQDLTDLAFEVHDRQITLLLSKGKKAQDGLQKQNGKSINEKVFLLAELGTALINARNAGADPFTAMDAVMPWEQFIKSVEEANQLARPIDYDYLDLLETKFYALRKYTPTLLKSFEFRSAQSSAPLLKAIDIIRGMNESGKRKVPDDAPLDFVPKRWLKHIYGNDGALNRHYYEMAVLTELKNRVRSGDVSIAGSRRYKDFEDYLLPKSDWTNIAPNETKLAVSLSVKEYIEERSGRLLQTIKWVSDHIGELDGVNIEKGKLHIDRLEKDSPDESRDFSLSLYGLLPRVKLADMLMEVANWTNFHAQFVHASSNRIPDEGETTILMAALMAMGTNIGLAKMAGSTPGISYRQMANAAQWRLYDDAMSKAQAVLVNFHHQLKLPLYWGDGTTSSSDGLRVQTGVPAIHADANPHYGTGKGVTIYRFVSDKFSSFYAKVINTNARDATHVIDGLLYHETDLSIEEHYTDTAGYTDQVFGLAHLLGFRFAPRLRDLADTKLFSIGKPSDFPNLEKLLRGQINVKIIQDNYDDVLRLAHSVRVGTVSASLMMGKIGSYARKNSLAAALQEMGRIEKTIFILEYLSSEALRRKINRGLNKGEAMNALARAIFFGKNGELRERDLQDQLQRASALNIIINAISVWNTVYLQKAVEYRSAQKNFSEELLSHISPLAWEHINFLGEYRFSFQQNTSLSSLRPLNQPEIE